MKVTIEFSDGAPTEVFEKVLSIHPPTELNLWWVIQEGELDGPSPATGFKYGPKWSFNPEVVRSVKETA